LTLTVLRLDWSTSSSSSLCSDHRERCAHDDDDDDDREDAGSGPLASDVNVDGNGDIDVAPDLRLTTLLLPLANPNSNGFE
jgi:hypothetical protein